MRREPSSGTALSFALTAVLVVLNLAYPSTISAQGTTSPVQELVLPGSPFAVALTPDGAYAFVSLSGAANGIAITTTTQGGATLLQVLPTGGPTFGLAVTSDGKYLVDTMQGTSWGVQFIDIQKAIAGDPGAILGVVWTGSNAGSRQIALSKDDHFAVVSNENNATVSVIDVTSALASHVWRSALVGNIPVEKWPVGLAFSHDGRYLYVTSEEANLGSPGLNPTACGTAPEGTLTVVDVLAAGSNPSASVLGKVYAGCSPVRVIVSQDDTVAWVSARGDNNVLAFHTNALLTSSPTALISRTPVGKAPAGIILFDQDQFLAVANSNRFVLNGTGTVSILDSHQALNGGGAAATVGSFDADQFPRQWALGNSSLYLTEFNSNVLAIFPASVARTTLVQSLNPSTTYQEAVFTASVASQNAQPPTGTVTFAINGIAPVTVPLSNGEATLKWAFQRAGKRTIKASYSGDAANLPSTSTTLTQVINPQATQTMLSSSLNPSSMEETVNYTATVTGQNGGTPTGTVTFTISGNNPVSVSLVNGQALFPWTYQRGGARTVTASYSGDTNNQASASNTVSQAVN